MTALDLLDPGNQSTGIADFVPSTFSENVEASFGDMMFRSRYNAAPFAIDNTSFRERDNLLKERFNVNDPFELIDTTAIDQKYSNPNMDGRIAMLNEKQAALDMFIRENRADPRLQGVRTRDEIEEFTKSVARQARTELQEVQSRSEPLAAFAGGLVGGVAGSFTDPINLATLPMGAGASAGIIRAMTVEALANMAIEAAQAPIVYQWQNELGFRYGAGEIGADILTAGIGGAAFTGIVRGTGAGLRAAGSRSMRFLDDMASKADGELKEALQYQSRVAHIDETVPITRPMQREDIAIHRETIQEVQTAIEEYREPDIKSADQKFKNFIDEASRIKKTLAETPDFNKLSDLKKVLGYTPESLTQFIKRTGGIGSTNFAGELKQIDAQKLPGLVRVNKVTEGTAQGVRVIDNQIDAVKQRAFDEGFFPEKNSYDEISNDEFIEAINKDLSGQKVLKIDDMEAVSIAQENNDIVAKFDREGITFDMSEEDIARRLSEISDEQNFYAPELNPVETMGRDIEIAETAQAAIDADFARLVESSPETKIIIDGEEKTLSQIQQEFTQEQNILNAIKICAVG